MVEISRDHHECIGLLCLLLGNNWVDDVVCRINRYQSWTLSLDSISRRSEPTVQRPSFKDAPSHCHDQDCLFLESSQLSVLLLLFICLLAEWLKQMYWWTSLKALMEVGNSPTWGLINFSCWCKTASSSFLFFLAKIWFDVDWSILYLKIFNIPAFWQYSTSNHCGS